MRSRRERDREGERRNEQVRGGSMHAHSNVHECTHASLHEFTL